MTYAQGGNSPFSGLAQAIAQKFNLNQSDVQSVISQYMTTQQANWKNSMKGNRQKWLASRLTSEVNADKITSSQASAITTELSTLQGQFPMSSFKGMTNSQRQSQFQTEMTDLKNWASAQNINLSLIPFGLGFRHGWHGNRNQPTATPTP